MISVIEVRFIFINTPEIFEDFGNTVVKSLMMNNNTDYMICKSCVNPFLSQEIKSCVVKFNEILKN